MPLLRRSSAVLWAVLFFSCLSPARADAPAPAVLEAEAQRIAVMAKVKPTAVAIFDAAGQGGGSGVLISPDGFLLSNFHVARPCGNAMKCGTPDGRVWDAVVVGLDPTGDVALIKLLGRDDFPHADLGDSDQLRAGDPVFAMGNPFLLATDFQPTVTWGIVSGVHRYQPPDGTLLEYADCIQTDASINPGNSGGPLFDAQGRLVGINGRCSFEKRGRVSVGVGYAISINQIKNFLGSLHSGRIVDHATLGARVATEDQGRVLVTDVLEQSDAYRRGLRVDDEVIAFGGRPIATANAFKNVLGTFPKGWRVPLSFRREGERRDVLVRLAGVHAQEDLIQKAAGRPPQIMPLPKPAPDEEGKPEPERKDKKKIELKPAPKPRGQKPGGQKPGGQKPGGPKPGGPMPLNVHLPPPPMPEAVKRVFEEKHGYANYYFNKIEQLRVWKAWQARGDFKDLAGRWTLQGHLQSGSAYRLRLGAADAVLEAPAGDFKWTPAAEAASLPPPGTGGLLPALHLWRRLAVEGPQAFGEVYYLGTAPWPGRDGLAFGRDAQTDVIVVSDRGVESRLYFDPVEGDLLALERYPDEHADPCELYFSEYHEVDGRFLPGRIEVRYGDDRYGVLKPSDYVLERAPSKP
ncbi:MAG: trypsin-like peptidase domain-containing protein [Thermoguttaceae bacterium]